MKRVRECPEAECCICFDQCETRSTCCKQPIHLTCRSSCGARCPYCRYEVPREKRFAHALFRVEQHRLFPNADVNLESVERCRAQCQTILRNTQAHLAAVRDNPMHACFTCQTFSRAQLVLCRSLLTEPNENDRAAMRASLDRLTQVMPLP